ncbi:hypothetical protein GLOIN_2v121831 [Rhizophagus irregularis DAOM 181602=DAOM 197198]|uniref:Uncharacterized protein n=1 Tax=Rhizophagus irregularis (strain DAOM 181602 / DAOM 197198 / MUCL 43194) TaxID=747089 RepID=A0A2P4PYH5_RHIID|nr:hypothetical protein GLOIN_2v121831 [Rhizophagus irregularis DAOM 181602=DAOM 197198]POG70433.1 hypothetical protein GLOIN_2v121831 [Rhizophagus irregularis DAOM 181602=DAOM 197198]GET61463.1 hypothetical protein GLOIN_2v121831 [Rhizophagus irregularis DAOM 181602=DAOM 197198]|eukprot:XP_025177299.1 hypothetical protein GLOIN_2v121831 [Rhizophagus irregularis DAOM 181602=DAOM 197198]
MINNCNFMMKKSHLIKSFSWFIFFMFLINVSSASTMCYVIVRDVAHVAFGNYLSFTIGLLLTFFSNPPDDEEGFIAKLKRFVIRTAVIQFMVLLALMTYMTIRFFSLNDKIVPSFINICSLIMYSLCGVITLTQVITNRRWRNIVRGFFFVPLYVIQIIFQIYFKINFSPSGYMIVFQWISILSILLAIPLFFICIFIFIMKEKFHKGRLLYIFIYPFIFQIYLHVGYVCFFLYCNEGYLSSVLLFFSSFALSNVLRSAYYLIFPRKKFLDSDIP